jgi:hypothetical protein
MLVWDRYGFDKKCTEIRYIELVFLQPAGSADHVEHSGTSTVQNVDVLFVMIGWACYG